jgi:hypothetical protein
MLDHPTKAHQADPAAEPQATPEPCARSLAESVRDMPVESLRRLARAMDAEDARAYPVEFPDHPGVTILGRTKLASWTPPGNGRGELPPPDAAGCLFQSEASCLLDGAEAILQLVIDRLEGSDPVAVCALHAAWDRLSLAGDLLGQA